MSTKRNRKPLNDALAQQFIYGEPSASTKPSSENSASESSPPADSSAINSSSSAVTNANPANSPLIDKLKLPPKQASVRFTVDLSESLHQRLTLLSATTGMKKAEIVRLVLNDALDDAGI